VSHLAHDRLQRDEGRRGELDLSPVRADEPRSRNVPNATA
jgi:hypothetical protein